MQPEDPDEVVADGQGELAELSKPVEDLSTVIRREQRRVAVIVLCLGVLIATVALMAGYFLFDFGDQIETNKDAVQTTQDEAQVTNDQVAGISKQVRESLLRGEKTLSCLTKAKQPARCLDLAAGAPGAQGGIGADGRPGAQGLRGQTGQQGAQGPAGIAGVSGRDGRDGTNGVDGAPGVGYDCTGKAVSPGGVPATCAGGPPGADGSDGADSTVPGPQGAQGAPGADSQVPGPQGPPGPAGTTCPATAVVTNQDGSQVTVCTPG